MFPNANTMTVQEAVQQAVSALKARKQQPAQKHAAAHTKRNEQDIKRVL